MKSLRIFVIVLALIVVLIATPYRNIVEEMECYSCNVCQDTHGLGMVDIDKGAYSQARAEVWGYICIPSDGNLYGVRYKHDGRSSLEYKRYDKNVYEERGLAGDVARSITKVFVYVGRKWILDSEAHAWIKAPPYCSRLIFY